MTKSSFSPRAAWINVVGIAAARAVAIVCGVATCAVVTLAPALAVDQPIPVAEIKRDTPVDFEKEILPILERNCIACHNAAKAESGVVLETPATILKGGKSGPSAAAGDPMSSMLFLVASRMSDPVMPPKDNKVNAKPLTSQELGLIKLWITEGAKGEVRGRTGQLKWQPLPPGVNPIFAVAMTPDGQFAACGRANQVFIYHVPSGQVVCRLTDPALIGGLYQNPGVAHLDIVQSLAFDPTGDLLASGGYREVKIWRRPTNTRLQNLAASGKGAVLALAVSADKKWIATGAEDNTVRLFEAATGKPGPVLSAHTAPITALRFTPDNARLVSGSADKSVRVWNVADGAAVAQLDLPAPITALTLAGDGSILATGGVGENIIRVWTLPKEPAFTIAGLPAPITSIAASLDKKLLAVAGGDGKVAIVDAATLAVAKSIEAHKGAATSVAFSANNARLVTSGADGATRAWNVADGMPVATVYGGATAVDAAALNPAGTQAASAWGEGLAAVWKLDVPAPRALAGDNGAAPTVGAVSANGQLLATDGLFEGKPAILIREIGSGNLVRAIVGHEGPITALAFQQDNARLISGSADKTARVWNLADGKELAKFAGHAAAVTAVALNSNGTQAISGAADNTLKSWNTADGAELKNFAGHTGVVTGVALASNDSFIVSGSADQTVRVWNPADGAAIRQIAPAAPVASLALSRDNNRLAVGCADNSLKVFQIDGNPAFTLAGHAGPVKSVAFSADNTRLVSGGADNQVIAWELTGGKAIELLPVPAALGFVRFAADANTLVVGAGDKSLQVVSLHFERVLAGNAKKITGLAYSNDGGVVYTASLDGTIRGYGAGDGNQRFAANHGAPVSGLAISPDGQWLASAGEDKHVRVWNAGNGGGGPQPQFGPFDQPVRSVAFSRDNNFVAGGSVTGETIVFDLKTAARIQAFRQQADSVAALSSSGEPQTARWISATAKEGARSWSHAALRQIVGHNGQVNALDTIAATPAQIISGGQDGLLKHINIDNGQAIRDYGHGAPVLAVAARPDGKRFVSVGENKQGRLWNAENGQPVAELKSTQDAWSGVTRANRALAKGQTHVQYRTQLNQQAEQAVPAANDAAKKAVDALAAAQKAFDEKVGPAQQATDAKTAADKALADAGAALKAAQEAQEKAKKDLDADANNTDKQTAKANADKAAAEANTKFEQAKAAAAEAEKKATEANTQKKIAEDAKNAAQKAMAETAKEVEKATANQAKAKESLTAATEAVKQLEEAVKAAMAAVTSAESPIRAVAFAPDGVRVVTAGDDNLLQSWDSNTGVAYEMYKGHAAAVRALAFVDGRTLVSGAADQSAGVWDLAPEWKLERTIGGLDKPDFVDRVIALRFSPDGQIIAAGGGEPSRSGEVKLFKVADGSLVRDLPEAHSDSVFGIDFSPDGKLMATCAADKFVKVWEVATGNRVKAFEGHTHHVLGIAWRTDGRFLASAGADNAIKVWDYETGEQKISIAGYAKQVTSIAFIGDTPNTVSTGGDATVRLHNVDNGQNFRNFGGATDFIYSAASTPDGKLIIAGGQDSVLRVWNGENAQLIQSIAPPVDPATAAGQQAAK